MASRIHREVYVRFWREYGTVEVDDRLCLPHDLDIQVSKLQLLKQSFLSQKYEMEDKAVRYFPNEIKQCEQRIADYESDIALAKENTPPDRETFPEMQIHGVVYTEKKEAGQANIQLPLSVSEQLPMEKYLLLPKENRYHINVFS